MHTRRGDLRARQVINCAGLFGDQLEQRLLGAASFAIHPRKGQFVVFDKAAAALLQHPATGTQRADQGVVFTRTVFGNLLAGPTAEEQDDREQARVDSDTLQRLIDAAVGADPGLRGMPVTATYAGLRPASEKRNTASARSTDATGSVSAASVPPVSPRRWASHATSIVSTRASASTKRFASRSGHRYRTSPNTCRATGSVPATTRSSATARWSPAGKSSPPGRPAASRRLRRPEASHSRLHGTLPGFLLQRAGRRAERRPPRPAPRHRELP
ncbi:FAD-dependent oxidoreductase [Pseudomonas aeruginosa]|nr:FAD-dependent oxidoreductase [Pseudomonas aeruginosa]